MAKNFVLNAEKRDRAGKGVARALRREGKTPAVIYGDNKDPITVTLPTKETTLEYQKGHMFTSLCELNVGKDSHKVLARDIQLHPVNDRVMHVDFLRVTDRTRLNVMIPVNFVNEELSPGLKDNGILNVIRHELELSVRANNIPESVDVDLGELEMGGALKTDEVEMPDGASLANTENVFTICTITAPKTIEEEEAEAEENAEAIAATAEGEDGEGGEAAEGEGGEEKAAEGGEENPAEE